VGLERKWWEQTRVRKERSKEKWFWKSMYGEAESGRNQEMQGKKKVGRGSEVRNGKKEN
jgi:hypothetical protein